MRHGEAANSNKVASDNYMTESQEYVEAEGFAPQQVFSCDKTGLFWKKMPKGGLRHTEVLARTQDNEGQAGLVVMWECKWGL